MTTLADLISELQSEVPAVDGVPTTAQYTQAIKDAVADFSRRCGLAKIGSISIVSGTPSYSLTDDFMALISMDALIGQGNVIIAPAGLIPVPLDWEETWTISNKIITFYPTPTYALTRYFKYKAAWILTGDEGSEEYADLGDNEKDIVMLKAKGFCYEKLSNSIASSGTLKYSFGAVSEDLSGNVESYQKRTYALHGEYSKACENYNGSAMFAGGL
jgi:hypothetical protein